MSQFRSPESRILHNCVLSVVTDTGTNFSCRSNQQVFGKEAARTKSHFTAGAVVVGTGQVVGYRTPFHAKVAATIAMIRLRNPDWFESKYLSNANDVLFYNNSRDTALRHSERVDSNKMEKEAPFLHFSRRGSRCIWVDCQALAEANRSTNDSVLKYNGREVDIEYEDWDSEKGDYFPFSQEKELELQSRWSKKKDDLVTYHHEANRLVRRTFDRVIRCQKYFDGIGGILPGGWVEVTVERQRKEGKDKYYISPGGHCFRSMVEVRRFLQHLPSVSASERSAALFAEDDAAADSAARNQERKKK